MAQQASAYSSREAPSVAKLLLIDDDALVRSAFADILGEAGHQIIEAPSGPAGIEAAREARPDLVLCDVSMPGMDGYAVLEALRADSGLASVPFLFLTGLAAEHHARAAMSLGADDYLTKTVSNQELTAAVEARLARREASRREADQRVEELQRSVAFLLPHELRTPLTVIIGGSEMLRELRHQLGPEEIGEMATAITKAAQRLHRMVENYLLHVGLDLERQPAAKHRPRALSGHSGRDVVARNARERASAYGREQDLDLDVADVEMPIATPYAGKIVYELVDNALKFSAVGTRVRVSLLASGGTVALTVMDHGRGLTADELGQLGAFRQFNRAVFEQQGSGLGLALVNGIVEASQGRFEIVSTPGERTTARVTWPH